MMGSIVSPSPSSVWHQIIEKHGHHPCDSTTVTGAVRQMRTRIRVLAQPKSMRPIIDATQRERQVDFVWSCLVSRSGAPVRSHRQRQIG